jgi:hypothetical protein
MIPDCAPRDVYADATFLTADEAAKTTGIDFLLDVRSATSGPVERLPQARYGVWRFRFGKKTARPHDAPGLWEIVDGESAATATLERVDASARSAICLRLGRFPVYAHSYERTADELFSEIAQWPQRVCRDLGDARGDYVDGPAVALSSAAARRTDSGALLRFALRLLVNRCARFARYLLTEERWNVGVIERPIASFLDEQDVASATWLARQDGGASLADPFGASARGVEAIVCERIDSSSGRGSIAVIERADGAVFGPPHGALESPVHASYPFIIEDDGKLYCIPETAQANEIALYEAVEFPRLWTKSATLLPDTAGNDATVVRYGDRFWLFAGLLDDGPLYKLCVWHAGRLHGPWTPHRANPVKIDIGSACSGGTPFVHAGELYRPGQDCSGAYGRAVVLNRVVELSPDVFREEAVVRVEPVRAGRYPLGLHTLSEFGDRTLIDGKYRVVNLRGLRYELSRPFRFLAKRRAESRTR